MSNLMVSLTALFGMTQSLNLASLPAPEPSKEVVAPAADRRTALEALVHDTSGGHARVSGARYFEVGKGLPWMSVVKRLDNLAREHKATRVALSGADPGKKLVEVWRTGAHTGVAAAMIAGQESASTIAYFDVALS